jgi:hypothetical protein
VLLNWIKADRDAALRKLTTIKKRLNEQKRDLPSSVVQITDALTVKLKENLVELQRQILQSAGTRPIRRSSQNGGAAPGN